MGAGSEAHGNAHTDAVSGDRPRASALDSEGLTASTPTGRVAGAREVRGSGGCGAPALQSEPETKADASPNAGSNAGGALHKESIENSPHPQIFHKESLSLVAIALWWRTAVSEIRSRTRVRRSAQPSRAPRFGEGKPAVESRWWRAASTELRSVHLDTALVAEREPGIRWHLRNALRPEIPRVLEARTGREAIDLAVAEKPSVVVVDTVLPDMRGIDVCREIRRRSPAWIVVLSAQLSERDKVRLFSVGADDCLTKPFSTLEFTARIRAYRRRVQAPPPHAW